MEIRKRVNLKCVCKAVSLEIKSLAALYSPPIYIFFLADTIEKVSNTVGMSITPPAIPESGDKERSSRSQPYKAHFCIKITRTEPFKEYQTIR